jgi:hypothetical protein
VEVLVRSWCFLLFGACVTPPSTPRPPPRDLGVGVPILVEGVGGLVRITSDRQPGQRVELVASLALGTACLPVLNGSCLGLDAPVYLGGAVTGPDRVAEVHFPVGSLPAGKDVWLQAVALRPGAADVSDLVRRSVGFGSADWDGDGLPDGEELVLGTDPFARDTDGGGALDAEEVFAFTDPHDSVDDLPFEFLCDDGLDGDSDGHVDCDDVDCACVETSCDNGVDDDGDGLVDCEDATCAEDPACLETACDDGIDDDGDGLVDCENEDCWSVDCHDSVVSWVTGGTLYTPVLNSPVSYGVNSVSGVFTGRVQVVGADTGPRTCDWALSGARNAAYSNAYFVIDAHCQLDRGFLPDPAELTLDRGVGLRSTDGLRYVAIPGPYAGSARIGLGEPRGLCANGQPPMTVYLDGDGDGYGVSSRVDLWGRLGGTQYTCVSLPGTTTVGGDCDDDDPTWSPATTQLAAGADCEDALPFDRDADGVPTMFDPDDRDGSVP